MPHISVPATIINNHHLDTVSEDACSRTPPCPLRPLQLPQQLDGCGDDTCSPYVCSNHYGFTAPFRMAMGEDRQRERRPMSLRPLQLPHQLDGHGGGATDKTPPHISVPATIIVTAPFRWPWGEDRQRERRPMSLQPL
ncbi:hypothetical protein AVEN_191666-1 [Araneus ventricosus]|uniref:Uncharacterized protein n=1 Tax=Araneus ventricosus TaxID=182803 RepID=A0A4Y1ZK59_ARAVE|nr:hypothetical protein AVEN_191666-1 [Araneus ventricosus]